VRAGHEYGKGFAPSRLTDRSALPASPLALLRLATAGEHHPNALGAVGLMIAALSRPGGLLRACINRSAQIRYQGKP
jgi:hypothetical protein